MLPTFPECKAITRADREQILEHTRKFLPYSDYNFNSLWSWDTNEDLGLAELNGNLIVTMPHYVSGLPVLSYLGTNEPKETVATLLEYTKEHNIMNGLTLIPDQSIKKLPVELFHIEEDRDNFDYLFSTRQLATLSGRAYKAKRHLSKRFAKHYPDASFTFNDLAEPTTAQQVLEVLEAWENTKQGDVETQLEHNAIKRILKLASMQESKLLLSGIYFKDELLAFSIDEILENNYAISHFYKQKNEYKGVSEFLNQHTAHYLYQSGVELWNWEQDLGISGLRRSKLSYRPVKFLKKYKITQS